MEAALRSREELSPALRSFGVRGMREDRARLQVEPRSGRERSKKSFEHQEILPVSSSSGHSGKVGKGTEKGRNRRWGTA